MVASELPVRVDPTELARTGMRWQHRVPVAAMSRLSKLVLSDSAVVATDVSFLVNAKKQIAIEGYAVVDLMVTCLRCMEPMAFVLQSEFKLMPVFDDEQAAELQGAYEPVLLGTDKKLDMLELIEEELLLSMPASCRHENEDCHAHALAVGGKSVASMSRFAKQLKETLQL